MVATSRVFSFDSRRVIFFQSARAVRAVVRASMGSRVRADGWLDCFISRTRTESSHHVILIILREVGIWIVSIRVGRRGDDESTHRARRLIGRLRSQSHRGSIGRFRVATASVVRLFRNRSRPSRAAKKRFRRTNETKRNSFTDAKRCARAREN